MEKINGMHTKVRVDWCELDIMGHVNNLMIQKYALAGSIDYMNSVGIRTDHQNGGIGPIVLRMDTRFLHELHFPDEVDVVTRVTQIRHTSMCTSCVLYDTAGNMISTTDFVLVYFDYDNHKKVALPQVAKDNIIALEKLMGNEVEVVD